MHVLLVEDSLADLTLIMEVLEDEKISVNVSVARDGIEAMEYLYKQGKFVDAISPDLVLLDLNLPRKDGREVLTEMKSSPELKSIPVVILTTSQAEEDIIKSYNLQASCYVTKNFDFDQFVKIVRSIDHFWFSAVHYPPKKKSTAKPISVLLIEDNSADAVFIEELLPSSVYEVTNCTSLLSAFEMNTENFDVILLDLSLPDGHGLQTCISVVAFAPETPIIILTGYNNEALGLAAVKLGAQDYILKQNIDENTLSRSIRYAIERTGWEKGIRQSAMQAKKSEAEAREAATNLKLSLRASKTGVWLWDFATNVITCDDQVLALFGLTNDTFEQGLEAFFNRIHVEDRKAFMETIQDAVEKKCGYQTEFRSQWSDGSIHYIASSGQVIEESSGPPFRMSGICTDLSKQKEEQHNAERLLILEEHEDFIATLTHDLKNPLIGADRILELLLRGDFGELENQQLKVLTVMKQSNSDMLALIQNLLEVYCYDQGAPPLKYTLVDMAELSNNCVVQLMTSANDSGVGLSIAFEPGDHTISADLISMKRVLMNLLGNGIKFTIAGGSVVISGRRQGDSYILEVEDTGSGIPRKDLELLFRRFSQTTTISKKSGASTGLGLYLCRQLVEAHGGEMSCTSEQGVGSIFRVIIPRGNHQTVHQQDHLGCSNEGSHSSSHSNA